MLGYHKLRCLSGYSNQRKNRFMFPLYALPKRKRTDPNADLHEMPILDRPNYPFLASVLDRAYREDQIKISGTDSDGKPVYEYAE